LIPELHAFTGVGLVLTLLLCSVAEITAKNMQAVHANKIDFVGSFFVVCRLRGKEKSSCRVLVTIHLYIWHFLPVFLLAMQE
jgi:hypothetical protein